MGMKEIIIDEVASITDRLFKRTVLEAAIVKMESIEQTLIQGIETLMRQSDQGDIDVRFRLAKAQLKVEALRFDIDEAKKLIERLDSDIAAFEKV